MSLRPGTRQAGPLFAPHPDDRDPLCAALGDAMAERLLSPEASDAFLRWLEGADDESWRAELESPPGTPAS